jgi:hypothetical protein
MVTVYMVSPYMVCDSLHGVWQSTLCHHTWCVTVYIVSPYMVCDSLHGVTIYGVWQSTLCHHIWYVSDYTLSPHNCNHHCLLFLNFHTLLEILSLCPFCTHFSFCIFTCRRYFYVFEPNSTSKTHLYIISLEIRSSLFSRSGVCSWSRILSKWLLCVCFDLMLFNTYSMNPSKAC